MELINNIYNERFLNKNIKNIRYDKLFNKKTIIFYYINNINYFYYKFNYNYIADCYSYAYNKNYIRNRIKKFPNINDYYELIKVNDINQ